MICCPRFSRRWIHPVVFIGCSLIGWSQVRAAETAATPDMPAARLQAYHDALAASGDAGRAVRWIQPICSNLLQLAQAVEHHEVSPAATPNWEYFQAVWFPLRNLFLENTGRLNARLESLGIPTDPRKLSPDAAAFSFFFMLRLLDTQTNGIRAMDSAATRDYRTVLESQKPILEEFGSGIKADLDAAARQAPDWIAGQTALAHFQKMAAAIDSNETAFTVLTASYLAGHQPEPPLARAFYALLQDGPDRYAEKWRWHANLQKLMIERAKLDADQKIPGGTAIYFPLYILLGHAGSPITAFRPAAQATPTDRGQVYHFDEAYEEDLPHQEMYSRESHLSQALEIAHYLEKAGVTDFDSIRHVLLAPFDVLVTGGPSGRWQIRIQEAGYAGYLDAFGKRASSELLPVD